MRYLDQIMPAGAQSWMSTRYSQVKLSDRSSEERQESADESSGYTYGEKHDQIATRTSGTTKAIWGFGIVVIILLSFLAGHFTRSVGTPTLSQINRQPNGAPGPPFDPESYQYHCGSSVEEALEHGCIFDMLTYSWTPSICYDNATSSEFTAWVKSPERHLGAFPFWRDTEGKHRIADEHELSKLVGQMVYATQEEHLGHCIFYTRWMERVHLGLARESRMFRGLAHSIHCNEELLDAVSEHPSKPPQMGHGPQTQFAINFNDC